MIFNRMFSHVNLIEKSMNTSALRQDVIANNIANVDTPNYKSKRVDFESMFRSAIYDQSDFKNFRTRDKHIDFGSPGPESVEPMVVENSHYTMRMDGNNVDIDQEMVEMAKNTLLYNTLTAKLNKEFGRLRVSITEAR